MTLALEATGLGKRYGRTWGLRDCSLSIPPGHVAALVGPNGAGKTTLLNSRSVSSDRAPGRSGRSAKHHARTSSALGRIGFVGQDTPLYADFTVAELLTMGEKLNPRWDQAGCDRTGSDVWRSRSTGGPDGSPADSGRRSRSRSRSRSSRSCWCSTSPWPALDPLARKDFLAALMGSVAERGLTVILSSHLIADLEHRCDYLIVLSESRVQVLGEVDDLLSRHSPGRSAHGTRPVAGVDVVVQSSHTDRQTTMLVRSDAAVTDPSWTVHPSASKSSCWRISPNRRRGCCRDRARAEPSGDLARVASASRPAPVRGGRDSPCSRCSCS